MHAQSTNLPDEKGCNVRFSVFLEIECLIHFTAGHV